MWIRVNPLEFLSLATHVPSLAERTGKEARQSSWHSICATPLLFPTLILEFQRVASTSIKTCNDFSTATVGWVLYPCLFHCYSNSHLFVEMWQISIICFLCKLFVNNEAGILKCFIGIHSNFQVSTWRCQNAAFLTVWFQCNYEISPHCVGGFSALCFPF